MSLLPRHRQPCRFSVHPPGTSPRFVVWGPGPKPSLGTDVGAGGDCPMNIRKILALGSLSLVAACGSSAGPPAPEPHPATRDTEPRATETLQLIVPTHSR